MLATKEMKVVTKNLSLFLSVEQPKRNILVFYNLPKHFTAGDSFSITPTLSLKASILQSPLFVLQVRKGVPVLSPDEEPLYEPLLPLIQEAMEAVEEVFKWEEFFPTPATYTWQ